VADAASAPLGGAAETTAEMGLVELYSAAAVAASVDPGGPSGQPHNPVATPMEVAGRAPPLLNVQGRGYRRPGSGGAWPPAILGEGVTARRRRR